MDKLELKQYAFLDAVFSYQIPALSKREAIEAAQERLYRCRLNRMEVRMLDSRDHVRSFQLERVEFLQLEDVQFTDYSGRFVVLGRVRVTLSRPLRLEEGLDEDVYRLPTSKLHNVSIWSLPDHDEPSFLTISDHRFIWRELVQEEPQRKVKVG